MKGYQITERDIELLKWVNGHRFVTALQVSRKWEVGLRRAQQRLKILGEIGVIDGKKILHGDSKVFWVIRKGIGLSGDDLVGGKVRLGTFEHDKRLVDLAIMLERQTGAMFEPERRLRRRKGVNKTGDPGHVTDGVLHMDEKQIGIELEIVQKERGRVRKIISALSQDWDYNEVWIYCATDAALNVWTDEAASYDFIKVEPWSI